MTEVKTFKITGEVKKPRTTIPFSLEVRATKDEDAVEQLYTDFGSRHKAKRIEIKVNKIEELKTIKSETGESGE